MTDHLPPWLEHLEDGQPEESRYATEARQALDEHTLSASHRAEVLALLDQAAATRELALALRAARRPWWRPW